MTLQRAIIPVQCTVHRMGKVAESKLWVEWPREGGGGWGGLGIMSGPGAYTRNYEHYGHYPTKQNCIKRIYYDFTIYRKGASSRRHLYYYIPCLSVTLHHRENMKKKGKYKGRHFPIFLYLTLLSQGRGLQARAQNESLTFDSLSPYLLYSKVRS